MKRGSIFIFVALLLTGCIALPEPEPFGPCLLRNGDFSEVDESGNLVGWNLNDWNTGAQLTVDGTVGYFGRSVRIDTTADSRGSVHQNVKMQEGRTYQFSVWYRTVSALAEKGAMVRMYVDSKPKANWEEDWLEYTDLEGLTIEITSSGNLQVFCSEDTDSEWLELTFRFTLPLGIAPPNMDGIVTIRVEMFNRFGDGSLWVGGMSLREVLNP